MTARAHLAHRAAALAACGLALCLAGCSLLGGARAPAGVEIAFEGLTGVGRDAALARIAHLFEDFAALERPDPVLDDAAFELELFLAEQGFRAPRVDARYEGRAGRLPLARFVVSTGPRTRLAGIDVRGIPDEERRAALATVRAAGLHEWYSERAAEAGAGALLDAYRLRGHARASVSPPIVDATAEWTAARVTYEVEPGPLHVLAAVEAQCAPEAWPESVPPDAVRAAVRDLVGAPWSPRVGRVARGRITAAFAEHGHADARVEELSGPIDPAAVVLRYRVEPGPRVRVGVLRFTGAEATRRAFLEGRVALEPGAWYRRSDLARSMRDLSRSGLFDRVTIDLEPAADALPEPGVETRDVVVALAEAASREFHVEPGYGSYERLRLGLGARQRNLFGTGRTLDLALSVAELAQRADLSLIDPWILGSDATAIATLFWNRREEPSFDLREHGVELGASWRLAEDWGVRGRWQYRRSETTDVAADAPEIDDDYGASEVSFEPTWDARDRFDDPRSGHLSRGGLDLSSAALGSEVEYARLRLEHSHYLPLASGTTLAASARAGLIAPLGATDQIPIQERFFNGGENSVRSYREAQLGPRDPSGEPIGGESALVASLELRQALGRRFQLAAFADAGTVELRHEDVLAFTDPGWALGLGLRYMLPIGPVRIDGALNPDPGPGDPDLVLHVSVGFSF